MGKSALSLKLLDLRHQQKLTQKQLSEKLNIGRTTYSYYETGSRIPDLETLLLIANYYKININDLVNETTFPDTAPTTASIYTKNDDDVRLLHHIKQKNVPLDSILSFNKDDFEFLINFKKLDLHNQDELKYLLNYKLRKEQN